MGNKTKGIKKTAGDGYDRIEWKDADDRLHRVRASDPHSVAELAPGRLSRIPPKFHGQTNIHGYYWFAGMGEHVFHESMAEYEALMLLDHLHDLVAVAAQPMLITFADGETHFPDFFANHADGHSTLVDVHLEEMTSEADKRKFAATQALCSRVGWEYELIGSLDQVSMWNLEWIARYRHPRYSPSDDVRERVIALATERSAFGQLRRALTTSRPGEHMPAVYHLMWRRLVQFDLTKPFTDDSPVWAA